MRPRKAKTRQTTIRLIVRFYVRLSRGHAPINTLNYGPYADGSKGLRGGDLPAVREDDEGPRRGMRPRAESRRRLESRSAETPPAAAGSRRLNGGRDVDARRERRLRMRSAAHHAAAIFKL